MSEKFGVTMSQEFQVDIPLEFSHEQQNFRLLEIPSELLGLITSEIPPSLFMKSKSLEANSHLAPGQKNAVLCTDDSTFDLRQVHSSNSVHLIVPTEIKADPYTHAPGNIGLTAIAQCTTTLELVPVSPDATSILKEALPLYNASVGLVERDIGIENSSKSAESGTKQDVFDNVPVSRRELEEAWLNLCAFETRGHAWIPSALDRSEVWKSIISAATLENADLVKGFSPSTLKHVVIEQDAYPEDLVDAVLRRLCKDSTNNLDSLVLSRDKCVTWIGDTLLETLSSSVSEIAETDFLNEWRSQLPEQWRRFAAFSELKCNYSRSSNGMIRFGIDAPGNSNSMASIPGKRLRKWHEKFKNTR